MRAFIAQYAVGLQAALRYKLNAFFYLSFVLVPPVAIFFLWRAVLGAGGTLGGYDLSALVTYYIVAQFFLANTPGPWPEVGESIRNGRLSLWLVRPASHYALYLARVISSFAFLWPVSLGGLIVVALILHPYFRWQADPVLVAAALLLWFGGVILICSLGYLLNLLAFWTERVDGLLGLVGQANPFLSGAVVPLDLLPLRQLWLLLPFRFAGWLPVQVYLGHIARQDIPGEFARLAIWLLAVLVLSRMAWQRGLRRYQGAGA
jgi:ABC-2 type transport system permease protein